MPSAFSVFCLLRACHTQRCCLEMGWADWVPSAQGRLSYLLSLIKLRGWAFLSASGGICRFCSALSSSQPGRRGKESQGQASLPRASQFGPQLRALPCWARPCGHLCIGERALLDIMAKMRTIASSGGPVSWTCCDSRVHTCIAFDMLPDPQHHCTLFYI